MHGFEQVVGIDLLVILHVTSFVIGEHCKPVQRFGRNQKVIAAGRVAKCLQQLGRVGLCEKGIARWNLDAGLVGDFSLAAFLPVQGLDFRR
ncbi:hypothetical protein SDC9_208820 [bioreactor metagenome]|uniref:Uncharacterized protein n=1 Tax=bioreactor metagenome TaxID=1076179 RepID=A0A645JCC0_9ZZZZ